MTPEEKTEALSNLVHSTGYQVLVEQMDEEVAYLEDKLAYATGAEEIKLLRLWQSTRHLRNVLRDRPQEAKQTVMALIDKPSGEFDPMKKYQEGMDELKNYYENAGIEWPPRFNEKPL